MSENISIIGAERTSILFLASSILSVALQVCFTVGSWLELTFPILIATFGVITVLMYACTILGLAKRMPSTWVKLDVSVSVLLSTISLIFSILLLSSCSNGEYPTILTGIVCIGGTVCIGVAAAIFFVFYRIVEDEDEEIPKPPGLPEDFDPKRKSVFI